MRVSRFPLSVVVENCGQSYKTAPDNIKRAFNQAIFEKILIYPDGVIVPEYAQPFESLYKPFLSPNNADSSVKTSLLPQWAKILKHPSNFFDRCFNKTLLVEISGIEPLTS